MDLESMHHKDGRVTVTIATRLPGEGIQIGVLRAGLMAAGVAVTDTSSPAPGITLTVKAPKESPDV